MRPQRGQLRTRPYARPSAPVRAIQVDHHWILFRNIRCCHMTIFKWKDVLGTWERTRMWALQFFFCDQKNWFWFFVLLKSEEIKFSSDLQKIRFFCFCWIFFKWNDTMEYYNIKLIWCWSTILTIDSKTAESERRRPSRCGFYGFSVVCSGSTNAGFT